MDKILVTGASGNLGGAVVKALVGRGIKVRAAARQTTKIKWTGLVQPVVFDYEDHGLHKAALDGVSGLFLIAPPLDAQAPAKLNPFIDKAKQMGVRHVVFTSALKMDSDEKSPLRIIEKHLLKSGLDCIILRPNFFMENFSVGWAAQMIANGEIRLAAGDAKTSFISVEDIARVAADCFVEKRSGAQYNLTGLEALSYGEVAQIVSDVCGRTVTYNPISEKRMTQDIRERGMLSESEIEYIIKLFAYTRKGLMGQTTNTVLELTGTSPILFKEFARKNANLWKVRKAA